MGKTRREGAVLPPAIVIRLNNEYQRQLFAEVRNAMARSRGGEIPSIEDVVETALTTQYRNLVGVTTPETTMHVAAIVLRSYVQAKHPGQSVEVAIDSSSAAFRIDVDGTTVEEFHLEPPGSEPPPEVSRIIQP